MLLCDIHLCISCSPCKLSFRCCLSRNNWRPCYGLSFFNFAYDTLVIGFPIRMGKAMKIARRFIKKNADELSGRRVAYYICCGFVDCFEEYAVKAIPDGLYERAIAVSCLGGSLEPSRFKGLDRLVVKAVRAEILGGGDNGEQRSDLSLPTVMDENIAQFADKIKSVE